MKNNLQTVAALLRLQARRMVVPEARMALRESVRRVTSIALVHETLSQSMGEEVDFDAVADQLAAMTVDVAATGSRATVERQTARSASCPERWPRRSRSCSPSSCRTRSSTVRRAPSGCRVNRRGEQLDLVVADDGAGLPADFHLEKAQRARACRSCARSSSEKCAERSHCARRPRRHRGRGGDTGDHREPSADRSCGQAVRRPVEALAPHHPALFLRLATPDSCVLAGVERPRQDSRR